MDGLSPFISNLGFVLGHMLVSSVLCGLIATLIAWYGFSCYKRIDRKVTDEINWKFSVSYQHYNRGHSLFEEKIDEVSRYLLERYSDEKFNNRFSGFLTQTIFIISTVTSYLMFAALITIFGFLVFYEHGFPNASLAFYLFPVTTLILSVLAFCADIFSMLITGRHLGEASHIRNIANNDINSLHSLHKYSLYEEALEEHLREQDAAA